MVRFFCGQISVYRRETMAFILYDEMFKGHVPSFLYSSYLRTNDGSINCFLIPLQNKLCLCFECDLCGSIATLVLFESTHVYALTWTCATANRILPLLSRFLIKSTKKSSTMMARWKYGTMDILRDWMERARIREMAWAKNNLPVGSRSWSSEWSSKV